MPIKLKMKTIILQFFLKNIILLKTLFYYFIIFILFYITQIFCNNSDEEYHSDKCVNLLLETLKN